MDYNKTLATADRLIKKYGRTITLRATASTPSLDPDKPYRGPGPTAVTTYTASGVFADTNAQKFGIETYFKDGISNAEKVVFVAATENYDHVTEIIDDGHTYSVQDFQTLKPGPVGLLYVFAVA